MKALPEFLTQMLDDLGRDGLAGDLDEELSRGRSLGWLAWQVGAAVVSALADPIRQHPLLTLRAVAVGWTTLMAVEVWVRRGLPFLPRPPLPEAVMQASFFWVSWSAAAFFASGWVVARLHRQHRLSLVLITMLSMTVTNATFVAWRTYYMLTTPQAYAPVWEQRLLLHGAIPFLAPLVAINALISLSLPLLVAVGGAFPRTPRNAVAGR